MKYILVYIKSFYQINYKHNNNYHKQRNKYSQADIYNIVFRPFKTAYSFLYIFDSATQCIKKIFTAFNKNICFHKLENRNKQSITCNKEKKGFITKSQRFISCLCLFMIFHMAIITYFEWNKFLSYFNFWWLIFCNG